MKTTIPGMGTTAPTADAILVAGILRGEAHALERMMREHNRRLFRVARSILRDDAEAEDAVQEGYIHAYQAMPSFRGEAKLSTWLTRIIVNQALERKRRPRLPMESHGGDEPDNRAAQVAGRPSETPEALAMRSELRHLIELAIDALPDTYRSVFMLRAVEGLSVEETALALGISQANTKTRFLRARSRLQESLGQQLGPLIENVFAFDGGRCDRIVARVLARIHGGQGLTCPTLPTTLPATAEPPSPTL